jgi:hypothetical protein
MEAWFPEVVVTDAISVRVSDLFGNPVQNAKVHFATTDGTLAPATPDYVLSDVNGIATKVWTEPEAEGFYTATASGLGLASGATGCEFSCPPPLNGPRPGLDPFQPIQDAFDDCGETCPPLAPVELLTGIVTFSRSNEIITSIGRSSGGVRQGRTAVTKPGAPQSIPR